MEIVEYGGQEAEDCNLSIPRGGPIFLPNLVGPYTTVPDFESSVLHELQILAAEISQDSSDVLEQDILVDELKILTEEELVEMALKEAFRDEDKNENSSQPLERSNTGTINKSNSRKRGRRKKNDHALDNSYIERVEPIVKIKQNQEDEKASVKLHSFNPSCKEIDSALKPSTRNERMKSLRSTSSRQVKSLSIHQNVPVQYPEVVLSVEVYHNIRKWTKTQEFLVLGQQTLASLKDKIYCSMDQVMQKAGQHDPSGYFFIEDTFCNDMRDPSAIDYSEPIFDWLRNSKDEALKKWECILTGDMRHKLIKTIVDDMPVSELPNFRAIEMHKIRLCDLRFRLGAGYLYCHQGDCCHTIVIRDMRLIHPDDVHNRAAYPLLTFQLKSRIQKCSVCNIFRATKVTVDDKWTPENPCYFCDECFSLLHEAEDGSLLYTDFTVDEYLHD